MSIWNVPLFQFKNDLSFLTKTIQHFERKLHPTLMSIALSGLVERGKVVVIASSHCPTAGRRSDEQIASPNSLRSFVSQ